MRSKKLRHRITDNNEYNISQIAKKTEVNQTRKHAKRVKLDFPLKQNFLCSGKQLSVHLPPERGFPKTWANRGCKKIISSHVAVVE